MAKSAKVVSPGDSVRIVCALEPCVLDTYESFQDLV